MTFLKKLPFLFLIPAATVSFTAHAFDAFCENDRSNPYTFVSYKIHLDGATDWGSAVLTLSEGTPPQNLPQNAVVLPCQKESSGDFVCVLNNWNGIRYDQTIFRWHSAKPHRWNDNWNDDLTLSFNIADTFVTYRCHE